VRMGPFQRGDEVRLQRVDERATKRAPAPRANAQAETGFSIEPSGVEASACRGATSASTGPW